MRYLTTKEALFIHSAVVDETGGTHGIRDMGLLEAAIAQPQQSFGGNDLYPDLYAKAAILVMGLTKNHPFLDGNKRTASVVLGVFLEVNGSRLNCLQDELVNFILNISTSKLSQTEVAKWLSKHSLHRKH